MERFLKDFLLIMIGSFLFAVGINYFIIPNMLSEGGVTGLTVIAHYLFDWSPGNVNFVLNIVLLLIGYKFFDKRMIIYTVISIFASSFFLFVTEDTAKLLTNDTLLAAIFAGGVVGLGVGFIFRAGGTIGGGTVLARIANQVWGLSMGKGVLITDIIVVIGSTFIIGTENAMYTFLVVWIGSKSIDFIVDGLDEKVGVIIISNGWTTILNKITTIMSRGVTVLDGKGYTGVSKEVLYIVINKHELIRLKKIIKEIDEHAYVTTHDVKD